MRLKMVFYGKKIIPIISLEMQKWLMIDYNQ